MQEQVNPAGPCWVLKRSLRCGAQLEGSDMDSLGIIRKLTIRKDSCTLIADAGSADDIKARVAQLKKELAESTSVYDGEKLSERIAKLSGGIAIVYVGATQSPAPDPLSASPSFRCPP